MKIRIKGNAIRYRLTRTDISTLAAHSFLEEKVNFAEATFSYALKISEGKELTSAYNNNTITLAIPVLLFNELQNTNRVGFENQHGSLHLLVEKDFVCIDNDIEDQSDNYPNPLAENYERKC